LLCLITSKPREDAYSVKVEECDFIEGKLPLPSTIRPNRLFGAEKAIISYKIGSLKESKAKEVEERLIKMLTS
jgi:mRNA interferase MazF